VLGNLKALLETPNIATPLNAEAAELYQKNKTEFEKTAKAWTTKYAS
jgi:ubiquitin-protein ligase